MTRAKARPQSPAVLRELKPGRRWLLLVYQLPSAPSNLRVRTWRRLQQLGALAVKQAVYVLPDSPTAREDFEWLKTEIKAAGGDASMFAADNVDSWSDDALVEEFRRARQEAYAMLAREIERLIGRLTATRRPRGTRAPAVRRLLDGFRERLSAIEHVDFFGSAGRDRVTTVLQQLEEKASDSRRPAEGPRTARRADPQNYANRLWVTRPRPAVDRMASAWFIKRFVDTHARFAFVADRQSAPHDAVPFDMFGVEFSHQGEGCTFETLCSVFAIDGPAVARIAAIVHDLDLKDGRFAAQEAPTVGVVIEGMQLSVPDDDALLEQGMALFEALYRVFELSARSAGPRPVARSRSRAPSRRRKRR
ncbi:MAG TPA: chromate resistance protein ChrB domain-containing protein [Vicinamibacterales bacterium]|nr:chromate resistance protein ChrB domain-containing protein [Vicinamibacterales bacterium]